MGQLDTAQTEEPGKEKKQAHPLNEIYMARRGVRNIGNAVADIGKAELAKRYVEYKLVSGAESEQGSTLSNAVSDLDPEDIDRLEYNIENYQSYKYFAEEAAGRLEVITKDFKTAVDTSVEAYRAEVTDLENAIQKKNGELDTFKQQPEMQTNSEAMRVAPDEQIQIEQWVDTHWRKRGIQTVEVPHRTTRDDVVLSDIDISFSLEDLESGVVENKLQVAINNVQEELSRVVESRRGLGKFWKDDTKRERQRILEYQKIFLDEMVPIIQRMQTYYADRSKEVDTKRVAKRAELMKELEQLEKKYNKLVALEK
ncbi:hypothetical protein COU88_00710 [Candidatus Roizmanbacteria bacterium CG10_big_fil_rev_8_21_14_0_10_39_6]|uniref:Uncharacterized protein n=1 Tax=Candidatus Roizmanbacteria bacterium CG10_big_fil_rev_8_21_14_0_10_39_6 TaxID=1974853 RepID=A0A2M8KTH1_9BACT|nr:MAG: hypothetical protein COU88_00710 [Candidatus Roizmanbacteria bacterium CG10_big_fil_rev_8_21_14_0_10_39_6]